MQEWLQPRGLDIRLPHESGQRAKAGKICNTGSLWGSGREQQTFRSHNILLNLQLQADFIFFTMWLSLLNRTWFTVTYKILPFIEKCYKSCL